MATRPATGHRSGHRGRLASRGSIRKAALVCGSELARALLVRAVMMATPISALSFDDDEPTLVHPREVTEVRAILARTSSMPAPIPPPLPASLKRVHRELAPDDLWLASLPAATRSLLDGVRSGRVCDVARVASPIASA